MFDFNDKLQFVQSHLKELGENDPERMGAFKKLHDACEQDGALSHKIKALMAVSLAVQAHCSYCIAIHVHSAMKAGANDHEIMESAWMGTLMGGGPALMYELEVKKALEDFHNAQE